MISSWRKRRAGRRAAAKNGDLELEELMIPSHFRCPISLELMKDPVTLATGITYDRQSIETWIDGGNQTCPITKQQLRNLDPIPNHTLRKMVQDWCVENQSYGIERIPTPRIPTSSVQVSEILSKITTASKRGDQSGCRELAAKIKALGKESDRNKRCIAANRAGSVLSAAFESFSRSASFDTNGAVLEEILSALTLLFPLDEQAKSNLGSAASLHCMVWFLKGGDLSARRNAILALKELLLEPDDALAEIEGALEALVKLIKEPICPTATKASLMVIYHMVNNSSSDNQNETNRERFADMGLVSLLLEKLADSERSVCEKAMGVLDGICSGEKGREKAYSHALTVPVLVKKLLRVSDFTTEFSVSILWKLWKNEKREHGVGGRVLLVEALQVGAFQKLLLLLQVGCTERTREKATELLKAMNLHRDRLELECIDSMDFKDIKRQF